MADNHRGDRLTYGSFSSTPVVDALLYSLATIKAEASHSQGKVVYQLTDDVFAKVKDAFEKLESRPSLFGTHYIRCFLEQPNKGKLLLQLLNDPCLQILDQSETSMCQTVSRILEESLCTCDNSFLFQRSLCFAAHLYSEWPIKIAQTLKSILQSPDCNFNQAKRLLVDVLSFETLQATNSQSSILQTVLCDETSSMMEALLKFESCLDVTFPLMGSVQNDKPFGSAHMYLQKASKQSKGPVEDICRTILAEFDRDKAVDERAMAPIMADEEKPHVTSPIVEVTSQAQSMHFTLLPGFVQFVNGRGVEHSGSRQDIECLCSPVQISLRFGYIQHILWSNRLDARACALAILHTNDDCLLLGNTLQAACPSLRAALNVYCILEDYFMLPNPLLVSWEISGGPSSPQGKSRLSFTIELLIHLANCPDSLSGDVFTATLLALWSNALRRIHELDIEIVDRLRLMLVSFINAQSFLFPWKTWYKYTTEAVDERILVGRKLFLFELLRDLAELSFPHRVRDATPRCLHAFIPTQKSPNTHIVPANVFDSFIRNADAETIKGIDAHRKESFAEYSVPIQLLDSILKVSWASMSYQKQLLRKFREVFHDFGEKIESVESPVGPEATGSNSLLDHVYCFWTNDHANRVQTLKNLIDVGIVDSSSIPLWLESEYVSGVFEQSWVRSLIIHAAHVTLKKWQHPVSSSVDEGLPASELGEATSVRAFFFRAFQVLQKKITSFSDAEDDEISAFLGKTSLANQPKAHWSRRNVLVVHSAVGLLRWLIRLYFTYQIPKAFPEHPYQVGEIIFPVGPSHDFLARLWRQSMLLLGNQKNTDQRKNAESELQSAQSGKHDAYQRYCARKRARASCDESG